MTHHPSLSHTTRHCHTPPVIVTHHLSLSHTTRHCHTPPVIVTHHSPLSHTTRHCHTPPVIVTHHPSLSHTTRHCHTPTVIVTHHPSLSHTTRHCHTPPVGSEQQQDTVHVTPDTTLHCDTPPVIVTHHPSLSHTTHPILHSAAGSRNSKPPSYTPAECSRRSPTLPSLGSATVSRCDHYSCRQSCPPHWTQTLAASGATSVHVSYAPATWWKHQRSTAPPPRSHFKSATDYVSKF